ncbi:uncharacterized protein [Solanum tuberosum]|uniref:uncharacterized protein n=1 Tax=Solanum tuberosum TaxID=4113 RepID=UPI00073A4A5A|nr:PREDICTED: uncharacterized protein LOC107061747 [Solanum tuberosum]
MLEVDVIIALTAQISAMQNMMSTHFSNMALGQQPAQVNAIQQPPSWCKICGGSNHDAELATHNLEKQFGQFASAQNSRPQRDLPGNTDPNPKQVNAVSTRSGLQLQELTPKERNTEVINTKSEPKEGELKENEVVAPEESVQPIVRPPLPFPQKFKKQKEDECFEIIANKRRLTEYESVALTEECSSRIQNKLPIKLKDPGSFTVQITIGQSIHALGLCDLRASINLMPTSLYKKLGLGSPKPTTIILQLADRSVARHEGVVEDVLVQVVSLIFPVDFVVLNFESDPEIPFILGQPFLATGRAMIDVTVGQLTMRAHDKVEVFDVYKALKFPVVYEELSAITVIDLEAEAKYIAAKDPLERVLVGDDIYVDVEANEMVQFLDVSPMVTAGESWEPLNRVLGLPPKPFIEEAPKLELKTLPAHLRYVFLGKDETLPVILSADLSDE